MATVRVPESPTDAMRDAFNDETPYLVRRNKMYDDGRQYEIVRRDHPEWREVVAEPMTVIERFVTSDEAERAVAILEFEYRYAAMLKAAGATG